jgi:hypothetical protein
MLSSSAGVREARVSLHGFALDFRLHLALQPGVRHVKPCSEFRPNSRCGGRRSGTLGRFQAGFHELAARITRL